MALVRIQFVQEKEKQRENTTFLQAYLPNANQ